MRQVTAMGFRSFEDAMGRGLGGQYYCSWNAASIEGLFGDSKPTCVSGGWLQLASRLQAGPLKADALRAF